MQYAFADLFRPVFSGILRHPVADDGLTQAQADQLMTGCLPYARPLFGGRPLSWWTSPRWEFECDI